MKASQELIDFVEDLRKEAASVNATRRSNTGYSWVDGGKLNGLMAGCRLLVAKLGPFGRVWDEMLQPPKNDRADDFDKVSAVLDAIANALAKGRLVTVEEMVSAEVLGDLLEHAEELLKAKFNLAAAIVLRAVLEERVRKLCVTHNCIPTASRPTIESFKQSLQAALVFDKIVVKDVDWMAGVGNAAAHNLPEYKAEDVPQLYQRVTAFLSRFSV
ncbi:MAG: hypothetical protein WA117_12590 [Verrucomicrobiia bacterium]